MKRTCKECGKVKVIEDFFTCGRKRGRVYWRHVCKTCDNRIKAQRRRPHLAAHGLVPFTPVVSNALLELIRRVGKAEAARRIGVTVEHVWRYEKHPPVMVRRYRAKHILDALAQVRAEGLVRHRRSILRGAAARGEVERAPEFGDPRSFYHQGLGAAENDRARARRAAAQQANGDAGAPVAQGPRNGTSSGPVSLGRERSLGGKRRELF